MRPLPLPSTPGRHASETETPIPTGPSHGCDSPSDSFASDYLSRHFTFARLPPSWPFYPPNPTRPGSPPRPRLVMQIGRGIPRFTSAERIGQSKHQPQPATEPNHHATPTAQSIMHTSHHLQQGELHGPRTSPSRSCHNPRFWNSFDSCVVSPLLGDCPSVTVLPRARSSFHSFHFFFYRSFIGSIATTYRQR